jgi:hypothetical protein
VVVWCFDFVNLGVLDAFVDDSGALINKGI